MTSRPSAQPIQPTGTGGSTGSQFSSRNPYRTSADDDGGEPAAQNSFYTPVQSPSGWLANSPTTQSQALASRPSDQTPSMSYPEVVHVPAAGPPLPAKPAAYWPDASPMPNYPRRGSSYQSGGQSEQRPALPRRPVSQQSFGHSEVPARPTLPPRSGSQQSFGQQEIRRRPLSQQSFNENDPRPALPHRPTSQQSFIFNGSPRSTISRRPVSQQSFNHPDTRPPLAHRPSSQQSARNGEPRRRTLSQLSQRVDQDDPPQLPSRRGSAQETHPGFTPPFQAASESSESAAAPQQEQQQRRPGGLSRNESYARRDSSQDHVGQPPRRRLTTGDIPITTVTYARNPQRLVAYLLPLPAPMLQGQRLDVPQRYMLYTPPAPHLLKPAPGEAKEGKRHRVKRVAQGQVRKAKCYEGRTVSLKGLHSKTLRAVDWAASAIKGADITFFARVPRKKPAIDELVLIHPLVDGHGPEDVHAEFKAQLARVQRKAAKHSVISVALFVPSLVIDTLAAIVWPFGGLAEIDGVWAYASLSAWLTSRSVAKRLQDKPLSTTSERERLRLRRELHGEPEGSLERGGSVDSGILRPAGERPARPASRTVHFQEELGDESETPDDGGAANKKKTLRVQLVPDEAMETMNHYFQEILHKRNPRAFPSAGVPPTKTDVLASIGWWPDRRGRHPNTQQDGDWDDENWQTRQVKEDLDKIMGKAAQEWDKWCRAYGKNPQRAMKEKGHSRTTAVLKKLHLKKETPGDGGQQTPQTGAQSDASPGFLASRKAAVLGILRARKPGSSEQQTPNAGAEDSAAAPAPGFVARQKGLASRGKKAIEKLRAKKESLASRNNARRHSKTESMASSV